MKRAEARGETYAPPESIRRSEIEPRDSTTKNSDGTMVSERRKTRTTSDNKLSPEDQVKLVAVETLEQELDRVQSDSTLKSKDRRSAKRKAEAIAAQESGVSVDELLQWYDEYKQHHIPRQQEDSKHSQSKIKEKKRRNPYIVFVGQLSYDTTKDALFRHFQNELGTDHKVTDETLSVRLLTDEKSKKSKGMAFVEVTDPELLYACLKLHHTFLEGRRINVERSAGGKAHSESRKSKIQKLRSDQTTLFDSVIEAVLSEFYEAGSIQKGELDEGVVALCKRHSATVVKASLALYVEKHGRDMDNPSAYLTFLLGRLAEEGIFDKEITNEKNRPYSTEERYERPAKKSRGVSNHTEILRK